MKECLLVVLMWFGPMFVLNLPLMITTCVEIHRRMEIDKITTKNVEQILSDREKQL